MGGFSGIPKIASQFDALGNRIGRTSGELKKIAEDSFKAIENIGKVQKAASGAADQLAKLNKELEKGGMHAEQGSLAMTEAGAMTGVTVMRGYPWPVWGELLTPEQKIAQGAGVRSGAAEAEVAKAFKDLADRIDKWQGDNNNYWSQLLNREIPYLQKGATSAQGAQDLIWSIAHHMIPGIMQELSDPKISLEMRKLLQELLQFVMSGTQKVDYLAKRFEEGNAGQKEVEKTVKRINEKQDAANKFAQEIGKAVAHVEKAVTGENVVFGMEPFSKDLERQTLALGFSTTGGH